jgi:hypothetical protein
MVTKKTIVNKPVTAKKPAGAFPNTPQGWADYEAQWDFAADEIYANRPPTWDGDNDDEPEEEWQSGEDYGEDE